jgi:hypothetical protein
MIHNYISRITTSAKLSALRNLDKKWTKITHRIEKKTIVKSSRTYAVKRGNSIHSLPLSFRDRFDT